MKASESWSALGAAGAVTVDGVELRVVELPFLQPVATANGTHRARPLVMVRLLGNRGGEPVEGWGEGAALADTAYDVENVERSYAALEESLIPALLEELARRGGRLPGPGELDGVRLAAPDTRLAFAALEMAVADAHLRSERRSLAELLGVGGRNVGLGAVVGQAQSIDGLLTEVAPLVDAGFTRVKMKIGPGWDIGPVDAVCDRWPDLRLQVDANGSYREEDGDHLAGLDRFGLLCLEQPLERTNLEGHARLARRLDTPVCLDESLGSPDSVRRAVEAGACSVVCIKPSRLGGLGPALELVEWCAAAGTPVWMGGMFESGYARGVNTTVAALPGFAWPGDLSPARWYLGDDLVVEPGLVRSGPGGGLAAHVPTGGGMGPTPDDGVLARYSTVLQQMGVIRP
jgi:O-succinylbenzoate synthase